MTPEEAEFAEADALLAATRAAVPVVAEDTPPEVVRALLGETDGQPAAAVLFRRGARLCCLERLPLVEDRPGLTLLVQSFAESTAVGGVAGSGTKLWPASVVLAKWLCQRPAEWWGPRVLELGAGCTGVPGLTAMLCAARPRGGAVETIWLTEQSDELLQSLRGNIALNKLPGPGPAEDEQAGARVHVERLEWHDPATFPGLKFDRILGAELIWAGCDPHRLVTAVRTLLAPGGAAHIVLPLGARGAEADLLAAAQQAGLEVESTVLDDPALHEDGPVAVAPRAGGAGASVAAAAASEEEEHAPAPTVDDEVPFVLHTLTVRE